MLAYQKEFIQFAIESNVLKFGEFTLKSGRTSPYFFNAGLFNTGMALAKLGRFYAEALQQSKISYDVLFGPAYKGIPLASATAVSLADKFGVNTPYAFNRKEAKDHGEGGTIVGAPLTGNILIVDDVITAGTAIREVISIIQAHQCTPAGVVVALDRQERGQGELSAIQEIEREFSIPVISIITLAHLLDYLEQDDSDMSRFAAPVAAYRATYGI